METLYKKCVAYMKDHCEKTGTDHLKDHQADLKACADEDEREDCRYNFIELVNEFCPPAELREELDEHFYG